MHIGLLDRLRYDSMSVEIPHQLTVGPEIFIRCASIHELEECPFVNDRSDPLNCVVKPGELDIIDKARSTILGLNQLQSFKKSSFRFQATKYRENALRWGTKNQTGISPLQNEETWAVGSIGCCSMRWKVLNGKWQNRPRVSCTFIGCPLQKSISRSFLTHCPHESEPILLLLLCCRSIKPPTGDRKLQRVRRTITRIFTEPETQYKHQTTGYKLLRRPNVKWWQIYHWRSTYLSIRLLKWNFTDNDISKFVSSMIYSSCLVLRSWRIKTKIQAYSSLSRSYKTYKKLCDWRLAN